MEPGISYATFADIARGLTRDLGAFAPEVALMVGVCALLLFDLWAGRERGHYTGALALAFLALAGWLAARGIAAPQETQALFRGMLVFDRYACFFKLLLIAGTAVSIVLTLCYRPLARSTMGEYYAVMLATLLGMALMASAADLLMIYLAVELVSIGSFVLVGYERDRRPSAEAALKYIIYGGVASACMIFGFSIFYGLSGGTALAQVGRVVAGDVDTLTVAAASVLALAGLAYKMAAVPFHFWCPDVYEGAPTPVTAFLSVTSKAAGLALFMRFVVSAGSFDGVPGWSWTQCAAVVAALSMTVGNLAAIYQTSVKRLLAYSSIAHVGYALMGVAAWDAVAGSGSGAPNGYQAAAFYLLVYTAMNLGAFLVVLVVQDRTGSDDLASFRGLGRRLPFMGFCMAVFLFALVGLPPTAGFPGKLHLFLVALNHQSLGGHRDLVWLVVVAGVNTVVSLYYYARILKALFFEQAGAHPRISYSALLAPLCLLLLVGCTLYWGVFFDGLVREARALNLVP